jgi:Tol biopolymer transport system component
VVGDLVLTSADGSNARTLLSEPGTIAAASVFWTPDGKWIVFGSQRNGNMAVLAIPAGGGTPRLLKADEGIIRIHGLTRDGSLYYGTRVLENDIYTVQLDPVSHVPVGQPSRFINTFVTHNGAPSFSPDGKWISWTSDREGPNGTRVGTVIVRPAAGGEEKIVDAATGSGWTPDSKALVKRGGDNGREIHQRVEIADGRVTEFYRPPEGSATSPLAETPDGNELLGFRCDSPAKPCDFVRYDLRTKSETVEPLSEFRQIYGRQAVSPDGKWLATVGIRGSGVSGSATLFVKPTAGGKLVELATGSFHQGIDRTPDSKQIVYAVAGASADESELMTVPVDGGAPKALSLKGDRMSIDPVGRLAYTVHTTRTATWVARNLLPSN